MGLGPTEGMQVRTTTGAVWAGRRRSLQALAVAVTLSMAGTAPAALAQPEGQPTPAYPSQEQVDQAEREVLTKAESVARIKAELALANQRLERAAIAAEQASEAYNGARWRLQEATAKLTTARADAKQARANVTGQRDEIAGLVTATYMAGGSLEGLRAFVSDDGPEAVMDKRLAFEGASTSMDAAYQRFQAASTLAEVFEAQAEDARAEQARAARDAEATRDQAAAAATAAQQVSAQVESTKRELVGQLAKAQGISVALAQQRQDALAAIAAQKAAEAAAKKAAAEAAAKAAAEAAAKAAQEKADKEDKGEDKGEDKDEDKGDGPDGPPAGGDDPAPTPTPDPPVPSGDAGKAIAFAKAQLGEPYRWGAAGPNAWDCSGLTMEAWAAGGVSLPHYSAAQYTAGTPISVGDLRPGDLVFWGSSPSSIHHVALYLGGGKIIHAPRTGRPVSIDSMYYWVPPNYFGRVG